MWKRGSIFGIVLAGASLLLLVGVSQADIMKRLDMATKTCRTFSERNVREGYKTFRALCKSCHTRNNDQGASFMYSESKTRRGWDRVFAKMYPGCAKNGSWESLALEDRLNLNDFLYTKAAGTYDPRCGA
jgi:hypothetical protein